MYGQWYGNVIGSSPLYVPVQFCTSKGAKVPVLSQVQAMNQTVPGTSIVCVRYGSWYGSWYGYQYYYEYRDSSRYETVTGTEGIGIGTGTGICMYQYG